MRAGNDLVADSRSGKLVDYDDFKGGSENHMWASNLSGLPVAASAFEYDRTLNGETTPFSYTPVMGTMVSVLSRGLPKLARFRSGSIGDGMTAPTVIATLVLAAGSTVSIIDRDLLLPGTYDLTGEGVTVVNEGATLPAGVALTGGILVLTVS